MTSPSAAASPASPSRPTLWLAGLLLVVGLCGHLWAAHVTGGSRIAYTHHVLGFFLILAVTGGVIAGVARVLWRSRVEAPVVVIAVVQAALGAWIALEQVRKGG